jgi:hypothetical protein
MVVVPLSRPAIEAQSSQSAETAAPMPWVRVAAAGALVAGGVLMLNGKRRAGLAVAAAGTTMALLEQQETLRAWWNEIPDYLDEAQRLLDHVQGAVAQLAGQREKLRRILSR